ncbi:carbohydrate ABC transporter permease [Mesomycoplasma neurolyticum]|uniref:Maltose transport system permease protein malF n=1 Tax=Mesomycoplasma neurolyticum TaxID=2120 RepID=A0A449A5A1_9BACT|nr:sugar ABC transporter permease [Mesomycoplasma neurolyticum]VEU59407.1 Maltose transport system permease protein malF [Mesomycoplasma neurolyticum]
MEKIYFWNWYGHRFDKKINDQKLDFYYYKQQINNVYNREKIKIYNNKKNNKQLFLKAKNALENKKNTTLKTLKIAYSNDLNIQKQSIKELNISNNLKNLIKFEIKKINLKLKESKRYVQNYFELLKNTSDDIHTKEKIIKGLILDAQEIEQKEFKKLAFLNISKKYYLSTKNLEINDISILDRLKLNDYEKTILNKDNNKEKIIFFYSKLVLKLNDLQKKKQLKLKDIKIIKKESKKKFLQNKKEIKISFENKIKNIEYSYNKEYFEQTNLIKQKKNQANKKLLSNKQKLLELQKLKETKLKNFYLKQKNDILKIKNKYKNNLQLIKKLHLFEMKYKKTILINNFYNLDSEKIKNIYSKLKDNLNNSKILNEFHNEINKSKKYYLEDKSLNKIVLTKLLKNNFSLIKNYWRKQNKILYVKALYYQEKSKILKDSSYESEFLEAKSNAAFNYVKDFSQELLKSNLEYKNAIYSLYLTDKDKNKKNAILLNNKNNDLKNNFKNEQINLKKMLKNKEITKKAYKTNLQKIKNFVNDEINELKLQNSEFKNKLILKTNFSKLLYKKKIFTKLYKSQILEAQKSIPIEANKYSNWKAMLLNLILPGSAEILIFKQYLKGFIMLLFTSLFYFVFVPFAFGLTWSKIGGVQGLIDLGSRIHNAAKGIVPDARYWMFGGIASIILLTITLAYNISSAVSAWRNGKFLSQGLRPLNWEQTKKWISNQGFPWMISIPGWFLIAFIVITPLLTSFLLSLSNTGFQHEPPGKTVDWVGFSQYGKWWIFRNNGLVLSLFRVMTWTFIWTFSAGFLVIIVGVIFALLVNNQHIKFKKFFRLIYIIPWAIPAFVTIIFLKSIFQADNDSLVNNILINLGIIKNGINYFSNIHTTRFLLIVIQTWLGHSYIFLLITGNLQSISKDVYEAASIDGANKKRQFSQITLPILLNSLMPLLIGQFIFMFNNFTIISLFSGGGPAYSQPTVFLEAGTDIMISWIFKLTQGTVQIDGNTAFASALVILSSSISVGFAAYGFAKNIKKGNN